MSVIMKPPAVEVAHEAWVDAGDDAGALCGSDRVEVSRGLGGSKIMPRRMLHKLYVTNELEKVSGSQSGVSGHPSPTFFLLFFSVKLQTNRPPPHLGWQAPTCPTTRDRRAAPRRRPGYKIMPIM